MPAKKKSKKKPARTKKAAARKRKPAKKLPSRKALPKKKVAKTRTAKKARKKASPANIVPFITEKSRPRSGGQSGDLQGLSNIESSNSESVDELLEEGNSFEAEAVAGVEHAGDADEEEVHTHEVLEDDVPGEYLDKD
jgi:hypothetical protein